MPPSSDQAALTERIDALLAVDRGSSDPFLTMLERTLTDGYACALALEAERWRLERRIGEVAAQLQEGNRELKAQELVLLSERHADAGAELTALRDRLAALRDRIALVKAA